MVTGAAGLSGRSEPPLVPPADQSAVAPAWVFEPVAPFWAYPVDPGAVMWQVAGDGWTVTGFDMGTDEATWDSNFLDDASGLPLVRSGDPIVFVNVMVTNTAEETMYVATGQPRLWATPTGRPYRQGLAYVTRHSEQLALEHGVRQDSLDVTATEITQVYAVRPRESFARGFALPLGWGREYVFVPSVRVYESPDAVIGHEVIFDQRSYTFAVPRTT
ncbi:MAG: hypothetical protein LBK54_00490 [Propionibacteriaceae bacterium]|jgi:hypothetical protein|nr:hypothetical protein [Propionibacteriaceae bacterium]